MNKVCSLFLLILTCHFSILAMEEGQRDWEREQHSQSIRERQQLTIEEGNEKKYLTSRRYRRKRMQSLRKNQSLDKKKLDNKNTKKYSSSKHLRRNKRTHSLRKKQSLDGKTIDAKIINKNNYFLITKKSIFNSNATKLASLTQKEEVFLKGRYASYFCDGALHILRSDGKRKEILLESGDQYLGFDHYKNLWIKNAKRLKIYNKKLDKIIELTEIKQFINGFAKYQLINGNKKKLHVDTEAKVIIEGEYIDDKKKIKIIYPNKNEEKILKESTKEKLFSKYSMIAHIDSDQGVIIINDFHQKHSKQKLEISTYFFSLKSGEQIFLKKQKIKSPLFLRSDFYVFLRLNNILGDLLKESIASDKKQRLYAIPIIHEIKEIDKKGYYNESTNIRIRFEAYKTDQIKFIEPKYCHESKRYFLPFFNKPSLLTTFQDEKRYNKRNDHWLKYFVPSPDGRFFVSSKTENGKNLALIDLKESKEFDLDFFHKDMVYQFDKDSKNLLLNDKNNFFVLNLENKMLYALEGYKLLDLNRSKNRAVLENGGIIAIYDLHNYEKLQDHGFLMMVDNDNVKQYKFIGDNKVIVIKKNKDFPKTHSSSIKFQKYEIRTYTIRNRERTISLSKRKRKK